MRFVIVALLMEFSFLRWSAVLRVIALNSVASSHSYSVFSFL